ncbi:gliding motility-associated C-terminal domain-containing protein [Ekhidna sp.]|uniref:T9SS type B sorting domain-containing protein n=1 Tax=Ekhidna sp. TaxID=2608089 RepID=UPI003559C679
MEDGNYILIVTDLVTGCTSATANITIGINLPSITPSMQVLQDNFTCDLSNPIGSATLTIAEGPNTNYSFAWYKGVTTAGTPIDNDDQIDNRVHGTYTVLITDNATLCTQTAQVNIGEFTPSLTVSSSSSVDHSDCYPSNGQVSVTPSLTFNPAGPPLGVSSNFTYQWYFGTSATAGNELVEGVDPGNLSTPTNVNTNTVSGLSAGDYTVVITETQTGCVSGIETVTVADEVSPYKPTIAFTKDIIPSSCTGDNGRITAEITALGAGAPSASGGGLNFTFEWYEGAQDYATLETTGSAAALTTGDFLVANPSPGNSVIVSDNGDTNVGGTTTLDQIVSGLYTVVMIDQNTGCRYFETIDLGFSGQQVTTTLTIDNVTECPDNGTARVGLSDNIILDVSAQSAQFTVGEAFTAAPSGAFGVIGADQLTGEVQVTLDDGSPALAVSDVITETSTGETATIDVIDKVGFATGPDEFDDISQYIVYLYSGSGVPADRFAPYTYEGRVFPYTYNPATGVILDGNGDPLASSPGPVLNAGDEAEFPELPAGDYVAIAQEINNPAFNPGSTSNCWTAASIDEEILDLAYEPIIQSSTSSANTNCDNTNGNGQLSITIIEDPNENLNPALDQQPNGYRFTWVKDADLSVVHSEDILTETATSTTLADLEPGTYTVTIGRLGGPANTPNNCEVSTTLTVGDNPEQHEIISATVNPNQDCNPLDGSIVINDGDITDNAADYNFTWYTTYIDPGNVGNVLLADAFVDGGLNNGDLGANSVSGLAAGTYYVEATHAVKTCETPAFSVEIEDQRVIPTFNVAQTAQDIVCDDATFTPTGQATLTITNGSAVPADYTISWFEDAAETQPLDGTGVVAAPLFSANNSVVDQLPAGTYFVRIEDNTTPGDGCVSVQRSVTIQQFNTTISVGATAGVDFNITPSDDCSPDNGGFEILDITETRPGGATTSISGGDYAIGDYSFDWFESDGVTPLADALVVTLNNGDPGANEVAGLAPGTYYVQITNTAAAGGTGCSQGASDFVEFIIEDETVNPTINLVGSITQDTYCDNTGNVGDGALTISIEDEGAAGTPADYTITWYRGTISAANEIFPGDGGLRGSANANGSLTALSDLATGNYTVVINKNLGDTPGTGNQGCTATAVYNVGSMDNIPTLNAAAIQASTEPDTLCTGNSGTLIIDDADVSTGDLTDFEIRIYTGAVGVGELAGSPYTNIAATSISYTNLAANNYYITAENTTTGCLAATAIINVKDSVRNPQITLVSMTPDEDCSGGVNAGALEVIIDGQFDHTDHFDVQWFNGFGAVGGSEIGGATTVSLTNAASGQYSVSVRNQNTDCSFFRNYTITNVPIYPSISDFAVGNNNICDDDNDNNPADVGTFELLETTFDGNTFDQTTMAGNYLLEVFTLPALTPVVDNNGATPFLFEELSAGDYRAIVTKIDSDCSSNGVDFEIIDVVQRPVVNIALQVADSTCSAGGTPNGSLRATARVGAVSGIDDTDPDYTFQWYIGSGTGTPLTNGVDPGNGSTPAGVATSNVSGLAADTYTVEVTRISTGCVTLEEFELPNIPTNVEIMSVDIVDATNCTPGNGTITVTSVNRNNVADYDFDYYDTDPTVGSPAPVFTGVAGAAYTTAAAGTYYIIGTNTVVNCTTPVFEIEVGEDLTYPDIVLDDFDFQTNCDPNNPNGRLLVLSDGQPENATYDFEWFYGTDDSDPLTSDDYTGGGNLTGETTNEVSGIAAGFYTVRVTNTITGCISFETYQMADDIPNPIAISTSTSANTNCISPNGKAAVSVISPAPGRSISDYNYYWFIGDLATVGTNPNPASADFTGTLIENIPDGDYVVLVIDQIDPVCQSQAKQVTVQDGTKRPTYALTTRDVTVCFDDKDGFAQVSVTDLSTVNIAWYDDASNLIGTTFYIDSLDAGMYSIELTHVITGCVSSEVFEILNNAVTPSAPTVIVNNGRTNCSFANGSAIANVDGVTNNFLFEWFDPTDMSTPYATGSQVFNLDTTTYLVRATNLATGCESPMTSVEIGYEVEDPVFEVSFNNSVCLRTEDGSTNQFTGSAIISFAEFNLATNYEWRDANGTLVGTNSRLIDAYPGDYTVTFTAENGCTYDAAFTIETSLTIYNGVSANADGKNDFFLIDCIDYFPNNNVKIYNRAGQRLYEVDGYNNTTIRFEGFSNVGGGGLQLPPGTYFYVVDLGNGQDPVQGYLELVR